MSRSSEVRYFSITLAVLLALTVCIKSDIVLSERKPLVFSTWEGFEADKCASIWLIRRFIDKNAVVRFFPKGEIIKEGIPFDTPDAKLRRYHNMCTFEAILKHYKIKDPNLTYIGKIIHDIEVNIWERKVLPETVFVQDGINQIILDSQNNREVIERSSKFFDSVYERVVVKSSDQSRRPHLPQIRRELRHGSERSRPSHPSPPNPLGLLMFQRPPNLLGIFLPSLFILPPESLEYSIHSPPVQLPFHHLHDLSWPVHPTKLANHLDQLRIYFFTLHICSPMLA